MQPVTPAGEECKGDLSRVGAKVKRSSAASGGITIGGDGDNTSLPKDRAYEVVEVIPSVRLVLRAKTWLSDTVVVRWNRHAVPPCRARDAFLRHRGHPDRTRPGGTRRESGSRPG